MTDSAEQFIKHQVDLPSPPTIAVRIIEEIKREDCTLDKLTQIIEMDPALVAKVLRISNSSHYRQVAKVDTLTRALSVLGLNAVKNIALSFVLAENLRGAAEGTFDYEFFWRRSVTTAVSSGLVCDFLGKPNEDIFITSLLQDIGMVFMNICRQHDYEKVLDESRLHLTPAEDIEREIFGFDHQELGSVMLSSWGLPKNIFEPIAYHHSPQSAPKEYRFFCEIMDIADSLSLIYHEAHSVESIQKIKCIMEEQYGKSIEEVDALIDSVADQTLELLKVFDLPAGKIKPYSQILQDANAELGKLNLSYEQLLLEYKTARDSAEQFAVELQKANKKLRELATTDGLTGLYNHRTFQDMLGRRVREANRHKRPLSLIIFDLDHFKKINDNYGHPTGDAVLKTIGKRILELLRGEDIVARYGGEEFAVILPETGVKGALRLAERIRKSIAETEILIQGIPLNVTVSLGVSAKQSQARDCEKNLLIESADKALYRAKNAGRNIVRVSIINAKN